MLSISQSALEECAHANTWVEGSTSWMCSATRSISSGPTSSLFQRMAWSTKTPLPCFTAHVQYLKQQDHDQLLSDDMCAMNLFCMNTLNSNLFAAASLTVSTALYFTE